MTTNEEIAAHLLQEYRDANPRSRAVSLVRYTRNGAGVKREGCILCGLDGPTWSARYPKTKRAKAWAEAHIAYHAELWRCERGCRMLALGLSALLPAITDELVRP